MRKMLFAMNPEISGKFLSMNYNQFVRENYHKDVSNLSSYIEQYTMSHPQFDYTSVLSALKHAASNPGDSVELTEFITDIYHGEIVASDRDVISGFELDLYLPELNLAIEVNGDYWHSTIKKDKKYHQLKSILCIKFLGL